MNSMFFRALSLALLSSSALMSRELPFSGDLTMGLAKSRFLTAYFTGEVSLSTGRDVTEGMESCRLKELERSLGSLFSVLSLVVVI